VGDWCTHADLECGRTSVRKYVADSIAIAKAPEFVWNLLTAAEQIPGWYDNWETVDRILPDGSIRVGATFRLSRRGHTAWCRVVVAEPRHRLHWEEVADDGSGVLVEFRISPDEVGGTVLTHTKTVIRHAAIAAHRQQG
jgi:uncharacterized protein YndB with AHSA1/START domain